jgi:hypothetical protein
MAVFDFERIASEVEWLRDNPEFEQRPATVMEFLGPGYLDIESMVRPGIKDALVTMFGDEVNPKKLAKVQRAMLTGGIGIGKTTIASICLPYMVHWVLCIKDPQKFFNLLPGSRIAFMQMSTSESQAREVIFGDIKARISHSEWFRENYPYDDKFTKQIRFDKDIWILPGDSAETTFEGYNILGGILDEADSHKVTTEKDYADSGYNTIHARITSRFQDRGLLIVIGQMKKARGFAAKKYKELMEDPNAYAHRMAIWESLGWEKYTSPEGKRDSFFYDLRRKQIIADGVGHVLAKSENILEIPNVYKQDFLNKPEMAARDLAGIPPEVADPFISLTHKVDAARERWIAKYGDEGPVDDNPTRPSFAKWFRAPNDPRKRVVHIDLAVSANGDALGFAMGHVSELVEIDDELKPYITIDCLLRVKAMPGSEIIIGDIRRYIYELKEDRKFRIKKVTMDGFQSTDTRQQLQKKRYEFDYVSMDKNKLPYEDLREAIYEDRIEFPPYLTYLHKGTTERVEIVVSELLGLADDGRKIDHPPDGSKDVADAMAGVCYTLMGERTYRRGLIRLDDRRRISHDSEYENSATGTDNVAAHNVTTVDFSLAPKTSPLSPTAGGLGLVLPSRLVPPSKN